MFSCEICEISKNTFFTEHLLATAFIPLKTTFVTLIQDRLEITSSSLMKETLEQVGKYVQN